MPGLPPALPLLLLLVGLALVGVSSPLAGAAEVVAGGGFIEVSSLATLRSYAAQDGVKIRLRPGVYTLDQADSRHFIELSGRHSHWDLRGVTLRIDTRLFRQSFPRQEAANDFYCALSLTGDGIVFEGLRTENFGDLPGRQSRNKIFNLAGAGIVLRDIDITTSGSSPWGYGSLYGISGGDVRKMNGIRIGWPARDVQVIGCRVHMRAMGHAIFVQGATNTTIRDCHVDGLLRPTDKILAEKSGYAFERNFRTRGHDYSEGVTLGPNGEIRAHEMIALSEDGIRLYPAGAAGHPTGRTTIAGCTVVRMRRGICTGLGPAADRVLDCEVRECVAAGFNAGSGDVLQRCRADAKFAEALCLPYGGSSGAEVDLTLLDSRGGAANDLVAVINGRAHRVRLRITDDAFLPAGMTIELATRRGYAFYQSREPLAQDIELRNETSAAVQLNPGATRNAITSRGDVRDLAAAAGQNVVHGIEAR